MSDVLVGNVQVIAPLAESLDNVSNAEADGANRQPRLSRKRNQIVENSTTARMRAMLDGRYFVQSTATPGTGISAAIQTSFSATSGLITVKNTGSSQIILDYLKLLVVTAPASATSLQLAAFLDNVAVADRLSSGGTALPAPVNANSNSTTSGADVTTTFGALTLAAASASQRRIARACARSVIAVVNDEIYLDFGDDAFAGSDDMGGTIAKRCVVSMPPVAIDPNWEFLINAWLPANSVTALNTEVELGFYKR